MKCQIGRWYEMLRHYLSFVFEESFSLFVCLEVDRIGWDGVWFAGRSGVARFDLNPWHFASVGLTHTRCWWKWLLGKVDEQARVPNDGSKQAARLIFLGTKTILNIDLVDLGRHTELWGTYKFLSFACIEFRAKLNFGPTSESRSPNFLLSMSILIHMSYPYSSRCIVANQQHHQLEHGRTQRNKE